MFAWMRRSMLPASIALSGDQGVSGSMGPHLLFPACVIPISSEQNLRGRVADGPSTHKPNWYEPGLRYYVAFERGTAGKTSDLEHGRSSCSASLADDHRQKA